MMHPRAPRILPITLSECSEEQTAMLAGMETLNLARVMVRHPDLMKAFGPFAYKMIGQSILSPRDREILILRALEKCDGIYEAAHHMIIARSVGMSDEEIAAVRAGDGKDFSEIEQALIQAADDLITAHCIRDAAWAILSRHFDQQQLIEMIFLVGEYAMMSMLTNSLGVEVEDNPENTYKPA